MLRIEPHGRELRQDQPRQPSAPAQQDATYIEVWPPYSDYLDLKATLEGLDDQIAFSKQVIEARSTQLARNKTLIGSPGGGRRGEALLHSLISCAGNLRIL